jgi:anti-anti-sigma regulatory factor
MSATGLPVRLVRGVPVITAPAVVSEDSAARFWAALAGWIANGYVTVVLDLSRTRACDPAGLDLLTSAHRRLEAEGGGLRLAHGAVAFASHEHAAGTETMLGPSVGHFATVAQAVDDLPAVAIEPVRHPGSWLASVYAAAGPAVLASAAARR